MLQTVFIFKLSKEKEKLLRKDKIPQLLIVTSPFSIYYRLDHQVYTRT